MTLSIMMLSTGVYIYMYLHTHVLHFGMLTAAVLHVVSSTNYSVFDSLMDWLPHNFYLHYQSTTHAVLRYILTILPRVSYRGGGGGSGIPPPPPRIWEKFIVIEKSVQIVNDDKLCELFMTGTKFTDCTPIFFSKYVENFISVLCWCINIYIPPPKPKILYETLLPVSNHIPPLPMLTGSQPSH